MAKKPKTEKPTRMLTCIVSGKQFPYKGYGRPPLYCPEIKAKIVAEQRKAARQKVAAKRAAEKAAKLKQAA